jgi:hypothetical protein
LQCESCCLETHARTPLHTIRVRGLAICGMMA